MAFVQVIHINSCHWVAISTVGVSAGCIQWLDCMHSSPSDESKEVIAGMMQCPKSECATSERIIRLSCFCIGLNNSSLLWFRPSQHVL